VVQLKTNMTRSGMVYIPKEIRDSFGRVLSIIPNARAAVIFPEGTDYDDVLRSLRIIMTDIKHRINLAEKAGALTGESRRRNRRSPRTLVGHSIEDSDSTQALSDGE